MKRKLPHRAVQLSVCYSQCSAQHPAGNFCTPRRTGLSGAETVGISSCGTSHLDTMCANQTLHLLWSPEEVEHLRRHKWFMLNSNTRTHTNLTQLAKRQVVHVWTTKSSWHHAPETPPPKKGHSSEQHGLVVEFRRAGSVSEEIQIAHD